MQLRDRWHLLGRRVKVAGRFRAEHGWNLWACWRMAKVHQRYMLLILAAMREDEAAIEQFRYELDHEDHIDWLTLNGAV